MRFRVEIDPDREEEILARVHRRTELIDRIEVLVQGRDRLTGYTEGDWKELSFSEIECVLVQEDKTYAVDIRGSGSG